MPWTEILSWRFALDVCVLSLVVFFAYHSIRSMGTWKIALGLAIAGLMFALASMLGLSGVEWLFAQFSPVAVLALVVIFQPEIRKILERATSIGFLRQKSTNDLPALLGNAVMELAQRKWGALLVFGGRDPLGQWLSEGNPLDALPSTSLLLSIFDPSSPGHDGAIVVENGRVSRFGVKLPLSTSSRLSPDLGTRHSAAMGLVERADAVVLVVSEERGIVTIFSNGIHQQLQSQEKVTTRIREHLEGAKSTRDRNDDNRRQKRALALEVAVSFAVVLLIRLLLATQS